MTDDAFNAALDAAIATGDANAIGSLRCVFADWLEDQGETDAAAGQRWMAANGKWPRLVLWSERQTEWQWTVWDKKGYVTKHWHLLVEKKSGPIWELCHISGHGDFRTRIDAEAALCKALAALAKREAKVTHA